VLSLSLSLALFLFLGFVVKFSYAPFLLLSSLPLSLPPVSCKTPLNYLGVLLCCFLPIAFSVLDDYHYTAFLFLFLFSLTSPLVSPRKCFSSCMCVCVVSLVLCKYSYLKVKKGAHTLFGPACKVGFFFFVCVSVCVGVRLCFRTRSAPDFLSFFYLL
jgi:hypothetical protein